MSATDPVTAAACLATLDISEREGLVARAAVMGERALTRLQDLRARPQVGDGRGRGLLLAVELVVTDDELDEMVAIVDGAIETAFH